MSKKERIRFEIDVLKTFILAFLTAVFGIFGFTLVNYQNINTLQSVGILLGLIFLFCVLYILIKRMIKNLNKLEEL